MCSNYHGVWRVVCDNQTLLAGVIAGLAAVFGGGLAYLAGAKQAKETRDAADRHIRRLEQQNADLIRTGIVSPRMLGATHQHWIKLRMDFDLDGTANAVEEYNLTRLPQDQKTNPAGRALAVTRTVFGKAREAVRTLDDTSNRT